MRVTSWDRLGLVLALSWAAAPGCGDDDDTADADGDADADTDADGDADTDADGDADTDADADDCAVPDTVCPPEHPQPGGPCSVEGECPYDAEEPDARWLYRCVDDAWEASYDCPAPGCSAVPPLAELCLDPFGDTLAGATVEIGPASVTEPFRPFQAGDSVDAVWGPQGGAMIPYRVRITAPSAVPECVGVTATLEVDGDVGEAFVSRLALHCGTSLAVFAVFPFPERLCAIDEAIATTLRVEVAGIGEASAVVEFTSQGCPNRQ